MAGLSSDRTTTGRKRKQIVTGTTGGSRFNEMRDRWGTMTTAAPKTTIAKTAAANLAKPGAAGTGYGVPTTYQAPAATRIQPTLGQDRPGAVAPASYGAPTGTGGMAVKPAEVGVSGANDITAPLRGRVGGYGIRPDAIPMLYQEPQTLLRMTMQNMGLDPTKNAGLYNMALPNADLVNALSMIALGGQKGFQQGENSQVLNYMDELFRQGLTRGGQGVDFSAGMNNLLGASAGSPLATMMNLDDPRGQYAAVSSLMLPLAEAGLHPLFARSLQKSLEGLRDEYFQQYAAGAKPPANFQGFAGQRLGL